jgi:hypothetical protein
MEIMGNIIATDSIIGISCLTKVEERTPFNKVAVLYQFNVFTTQSSIQLRGQVSVLSSSDMKGKTVQEWEIIKDIERFKLNYCDAYEAVFNLRKKDGEEIPKYYHQVKEGALKSLEEADRFILNRKQEEGN